ncbi:hypothetical protein D049_0597 [Vibrio parahaemolyticus VPTS-2010]|nr:hypothetical protein D019_3082 [Vibrio parahaemolyticus VP2007-095]ETJ98781.1 hypothetical protein D041_0054 [Vibrio parahaemolyticus EKP-008]EXJ47994.1 hypothetical protein D049_0597 [Vibrio parahaemolyticus VPTS-2010]
MLDLFKTTVILTVNKRILFFGVQIFYLQPKVQLRRSMERALK